MPTSSRSRYLPHGPFLAELREKVDEHFARSGRSRHDAPRMYLKTAVMLSWLAASYALLVFWAPNGWAVALLLLALGLAVAGIGFNVQHDGGHGGYSRRKSVNRLMAFSLDVIGGSSYIWSWKHNVFHHSNPNVSGLDLDIDIRPFCRLSPDQPKRSGHRFQHLYIWPLYAFLAVKWHFVDDFKDLIIGRMGTQRFPRPRGTALWALLGGKAVFLALAFGLPSLYHPLWKVALCYAVTSAVVSLTLAITFQLAHCVEGARFPSLEGGTSRIGAEWSAHQVEASVNFATRNRMLTWYVGGLNFQIEHHLFPTICHVHLPALAPIVEDVCRRHGVSYRSFATVGEALGAHARWIHHLGTEELAPAAS